MVESFATYYIFITGEVLEIEIIIFTQSPKMRNHQLYLNFFICFDKFFLRPIFSRRKIWFSFLQRVMKFENSRGTFSCSDMAETNQIMQFSLNRRENGSTCSRQMSKVSHRLKQLKYLKILKLTEYWGARSGTGRSGTRFF